jgi:hypothetical protein
LRFLPVHSPSHFFPDFTSSPPCLLFFATLY